MTTEEIKFVDEVPDIACTLSEAALAERTSGTLSELLAGATATRELDDGYELTYPGDGDWLSKLSDFIAFERECCAFFQFEIVVAPQRGPVALRLRGPDGVKEFVSRMAEGS